MKVVSALLAASVVFVGTSLSTASAQTNDPALDKLAADWAATFAKGDAKALAAFYTENAVRITPEAGKVIGRSAIEKEFLTNFAGPWKGAKITIKVGALQPVGTDIAVNEGTYEVSGITGPDGKPVVVKGSYLNTIIKKGGAWMLASNAAVLPQPAPAK
jgi:uncharacterized protein (TIGR02246 family)